MTELEELMKCENKRSPNNDLKSQERSKVSNIDEAIDEIESKLKQDNATTIHNDYEDDNSSEQLNDIKEPKGILKRVRKFKRRTWTFIVIVISILSYTIYNMYSFNTLLDIILYKCSTDPNLFKAPKYVKVNTINFISNEDEENSTGADLTSDGSVTTASNIKYTIPLFLQYDERWGSFEIGVGGTMQSSGCAITSMSMVISGLKPKNISIVDKNGDGVADPKECAIYCNAKWSAHGTGGWSNLTNFAKEVGLEMEEKAPSDSAYVYEQLKKNKPVVINVGAGKFTKRGHFMVLTEVKPDGKVHVNDCGHEQYCGDYDMSFLTSQTKAFYIVWKKGDPIFEGGGGGTYNVKGKNGMFHGMYADIINKWSAQYGIDPFIVAGIIHTESNFDKSLPPNNCMASGLCQLTPDCVQDAQERFGWKHSWSETYPDPNLAVQCMLIALTKDNLVTAKKINYTGEVYFDKVTDVMLRAYNAGSGNVIKYNGYGCNDENRNYVPKVYKAYKYYVEHKDKPPYMYPGEGTGTGR